MRYRICLTTLLGVTLLDPAIPARAQDTSGWPDWLKTAMAREASELESHAISTPDERFRFKLAGQPGDSSSFEGGWYFESDIGAESPLECYIFTQASDLATLTSNMAEVNIQTQAENNAGPVGNRDAFAIDAGAIGGSPFLAIEWMYTLGEAPNVLLGYTKVRAAINGDIMQACAHNYPGFRDTFARMFEEFVRTTEQPDARPEPYYEEIVLQSFGDKNVGFVRTAFVEDVEGDTSITTTSASLLPVGPGEVSVDDATIRSWSTPDGLLINSYVAAARNGELVNDLEFERHDDGAWVVAGMFQGKDIEQRIEDSPDPLSDLGLMQAVRNLYAGTDAEVAFPVWVSDADPTRILEGRVRRDDDDIEGQGILELGPLVMTARFDDNGSATYATMSVGAVVVTMQRVWSRGAIP